VPTGRWSCRGREKTSMVEGSGLRVANNEGRRQLPSAFVPFHP
jgi:hypothetical protein